MALEGTKVLDLTSAAPGPGSLCTMILADFGADVLKVQEPVSTAGRRSEQASGTEISFLEGVNSLDRNKRSVVIDLKTEEGKEILYKLVKNSDVVVEQWRPGVSKRLAVDYDRLKSINDRLVYCSITGYGQNGPYKYLVGHDVNYIAFAGALGVIGKKGGSPVMPLNLVADYAGGGLCASIGITIALLARGRTGRGQFIDMSMTDGVIYLMTRYFSEYFAGTWIPERGTHRSGGAFPHTNVYKTKDGRHITIASAEPWFWANLCRVLSREDFIPYQYAKGAKRREIFRFFRQIFLTRTRDEWFHTLSKTDTCVGKVQTFDEVVEHPHLLARKMFFELDNLRGDKVKQVGIGIKLSDTPGSIRSFVPKRGQHTDETLMGLGYTEKEITALRRKGCIG